MTMPKLIEEIVKEGVPVTLQLMEDGRAGYNLNSEAKSGVVLTLDENDNGTESFTAHMRYDKTEKNITDIYDVICTVKDAMCSRDFVADHWVQVMIKHGYAKEEVKTVRTIHF